MSKRNEKDRGAKKRATEMVVEFKGLAYKEGLKRLGFTNLELIRKWLFNLIIHES